MNGITHKQAQKYVRLDLDGLLTDDQRRDLETHLSGCEACRLEAQAFSTLTSRLQSGFRSRWDAQGGPSENVMANVRSQTRRIIMSNRINVAFRVLGGIAAVLVFGFLINKVVLQMRDHSVAAKVTATPDNVSPVSSGRLLAFTSPAENGDLDIYTVYSDGSGLINLTNNPAQDTNPIWSPDGSRIAFESERDGNREIYVMNIDGSGLTRLTHDTANDVLNDAWTSSQPWSPDGTHILYRNDHNGQWDLFVANTDGSGVTQLTQDGDHAVDGGFFWSPDGTKVAYATGWATDNQSEVYVINADGSGRQQMPVPKVAFSSNLFGWSANGQALYYNVEDCYRNTWGDCAGPKEGLYRGTLDGSDPILLASTDGNILGWIIQPDGNVRYFKDKQPFMATTRRGIDVWTWWQAVNGKPNQLNEWSTLQEKCQTPDIDSVGITRSAYTDGLGTETQMLVAVYCGNDDQTWLYLVNADGSKHQLLLNAALTGRVDVFRLSDDGRMALLDNTDSFSQITKVYALDLLTALQDPATRPVPVAGSDVRIEPVPFNGVVKAVPTSVTASTQAPPLPILKNNLIVFTRESDLYVMQSDGKGLKRLTAGSPGASSPQWSPDGKQILFNGAENNISGLYLIDLDDNVPTRLADSTGPTAWSPDGRQIATMTLDYLNLKNSLLKIINADGSNLRTIPLDTINGELGPYEQVVRWSTDGKYVQFLVAKFSGSVPYSKSDRWTIYQVNAEDGSMEVLLETKIPILNWYGDAGNLTYITNDEDKNELQWVQNQSVISIWKRPFYSAQTFSWWSPDKHKLLIAVDDKGQGHARLYLVNSDGSSLQELTQNSVYSYTYGQVMGWSPDGQYLVFSSDIASAGNYDLYTLDIGAALHDPTIAPIRLTTSGFGEFEPAWQPNP